MQKTQVQAKESSIVKTSPELLIAQAIDKGVSVETMERLLAMRRELKAEWAKEQFDAAMAKFQGECPVIKKKKEGGKTKAGTVAYKYAPLDDIVQQTKGLIEKNGFSYLIKTDVKEGKVKITCIVKHGAGHSEDTSVEMPLTTKTDIMSAPQQVAATITFAKRYAFCNAFGILTGDEDNEDKTVPEKKQETKARANQKEWYENSKKMIEACQDKKQLQEWKEKIGKNKKVKQQYRFELITLINEKLGIAKK